MDPHRPGPSDAELTRYLAGDCSPVDARAVERWLDESEGHRERLEQLRTLWSAPSVAPPADVERMWSAVRRTIDARPLHASHPARQIGMQPRAGGLWRFAAAAGFVVVAGWAARAAWHRPEVAVSRPAADSTAATREYVTGRGQQARLQLADGSNITIAPGSRVRVRPTFGSAADPTRDVYLDGEAYFVVRHDSLHPFRVHAGGAITEDIGTAFVVTAYEEMRGSRVIVTEGSVLLRGRVSPAARAPADSAQAVVLGRGDAAYLERNGATRVEHEVRTERYLAWTKGVLALERVELREAIPMLERWYDVELRVADAALLDHHLTADLQMESPAAMVRRLASALGMKARVEGRVVTLFPADSAGQR
jgi:transmembrane sensor